MNDLNIITGPFVSSKVEGEKRVHFKVVELRSIQQFEKHLLITTILLKMEGFLEVRSLENKSVYSSVAAM